MAAPLPKAKRTEYERRAWLLRQQGWSEQRIADELQVCDSTICRMLKRTEARLAKAFEEEAARIKARQTAQLEHLYAEAVEEWERSKQPAELERTVTKAVVQSAEGEAIETEPRQFLEEVHTVEKKGQVGNPALLAQARGTLADIRAIWGLDAPKRVDATSEGKPFKVYVNFDPADDGAGADEAEGV